MLKRTILAAAGALLLAPSAAHAAACANGVSGYTMNDGLLGKQCVAAVVLSDGRLLGAYTPQDAVGNAFGTAGNPFFMGAADGALVSLGAKADSAYGGSGSAGLVAISKGLYALLTSLQSANGATSDTAFAGTGAASQIAALKGLYSQLGTLLTANGALADAAYAGTGNASQIAALKGVYAQLGALLTANGGVADAAYAGSGNASQIAALKGLYAQIATLAAANGSAADVAYTGSGSASQIALLKAIYGQAAPGGAVGATPPNGALFPWVQQAPGSVFDVRALLGGNPLTASNPMPTQATVGGAAVSASNPDPVTNYVGGAAVSGTNPLPTSGVTVAMQRSTVLEACHTFTKATAASALRTLKVGANSSSALYLFLIDATAAPTSGSSVASTLIQPQFVGSNGSRIEGVYNYGGTPVSSTTGFTACLSTTAEPTYTATGAIGWFTAQVQ